MKKKGLDRRADAGKKVEMLKVNDVDLELENKIRRGKKEKTQQEKGVSSRNLKTTGALGIGKPRNVEISDGDAEVVVWPEKSMETETF
jgi:hypothetical protein